MRAEKVLFRNLYIYILYAYICITIINVKEAMKFKESKEQLYMRVWRKEREG